VESYKERHLGKLQPYLHNIRLAMKCLSVTYTLAYYDTEIPSLNKVPIRPKVSLLYKLFSSSLAVSKNKLKCSSLARFSCKSNIYELN
jgi:hypothetical protein